MADLALAEAQDLRQVARSAAYMVYALELKL